MTVDGLRGLYGIVGRDIGPGGAPRDPVAVARAYLVAGAACVQLRLKSEPASSVLEVARRVGLLCRTAGVPFVVNDRADVAALCGADGVHVGQDDLAPGAARALLREPTWIGVSTHDEAEIDAALGAGADYLGYGPVFASVTKAGARPARGLRALEAAVERAGKVPVVAIGGITTPGRAVAALGAGACAVAVLSGVARAADMGLAAVSIAEACRGALR